MLNLCGQLTPRPRMLFVLLVLLTMIHGLPAEAADVPSNGWVVWASNRKDSRHEIYLMKADGTGVKRLTFKGAEFPGWSPDGKWIAYTATTDDSTHVIRHNGSGDKKVCDGKFTFWMWDGSGLICRKTDSYYLINPDTGSSTLKFKKSDFSKIGSKALNPGGITHDGKYLLAHTDLYRTGFSGDNGTFKAYHAAVILDFSNKSKVYYFGSGCEPTTPPKGTVVYHVCGDCPTKPDPYRMLLADLSTRSSYKAEIAHKDSDWGHEYFPRISNDNVWMVYGATTGCHDHDTCDYEIYVHRTGAVGVARAHITTDTSNDQWPHLFVGTLPSFGCTTASQCDDSDPCTTDTCSAGTCKHAAVSGCCKTDGACGDSDPCTADSCGSSNTCLNKAISGCCTKDSECSDSNTCTKDSCSANKCKYTALSGCCSSDADCKDSNVCTTDSCDTKTGSCKNAAVSGCCAVDTDCDDSDACTLDNCGSSNTCQHQSKSGCCTADSDCDDSDACTADSCDLTTNACLNAAISGCGAADAGVGADAGPGADAGVAGDLGGSDLAGGGGANNAKDALVGGCSLAGPPVSPWPLLALIVALVVCRRRRRG